MLVFLNVFCLEEETKVCLFAVFVYWKPLRILLPEKCLKLSQTICFHQPSLYLSVHQCAGLLQNGTTTANVTLDASDFFDTPKALKLCQRYVQTCQCGTSWKGLVKSQNTESTIQGRTLVWCLIAQKRSFVHIQDEGADADSNRTRTSQRHRSTRHWLRA